MDFQNFAQSVSDQAVQKITEDIYQEIVCNMVVYWIKVGLFAGVVIALLGTILGLAKFTKLDLTTYTGCMLTGKPKGTAPFIAGFIFHMLASAALGVAYLYVINIFGIPGTLIYALGLGVIHTLLSASLMLMFDAINPCVANKTVPRLGFAAWAQGAHAVIAYIITHVTFAVVVVMMLTR